MEDIWHQQQQLFRHWCNMVLCGSQKAGLSNRPVYQKRLLNDMPAWVVDYMWLLTIWGVLMEVATFSNAGAPKQIVHTAKQVQAKRWSLISNRLQEVTLWYRMSNHNHTRNNNCDRYHALRVCLSNKHRVK